MCLIAVVAGPERGSVWSDGAGFDATGKRISDNTSKIFRLAGGQIVLAVGDAAALKFAQGLRMLALSTQAVRDVIIRFTQEPAAVNCSLTLIGPHEGKLYVFTASATGPNEYRCQGNTIERGLVTFMDGFFDEPDFPRQRLEQIARMEFAQARAAMDELFRRMIVSHPNEMGGELFFEEITR